MSTKTVVSVVTFVVIFIVLLLLFRPWESSNRILFYNVEYGAEKYSIGKIVDMIEESKADVVVLAEIYTQNGINVVPLIANSLGFNYVIFESNKSAIISRHNVRMVDSAGIGYIDNYCLYVVSIHLPDFPYQPNQASGIEYCFDEGICQKTDGNVGSHEIIEQAHLARGKDVDMILEKINSLDGTIVVAGDFNEPSHLDWTKRAQTAGLHPRVVEYPTSMKFMQAGLTDVYRYVYPDEVKYPGYTWPTYAPEYPWRADRIDFIYINNAKKKSIRNCKLICDSNGSDHCAILVETNLLV